MEDLNLTPPPPKTTNKVRNSRVYKQTRTKNYWEHLVKRSGQADVEATLIKEVDFKKLGTNSSLLNPRVD